MDNPTQETVITEEQWRAWGEKGKRREEATAWKMKVVAGIAIGLVALGSAVYFVVAK